MFHNHLNGLAVDGRSAFLEVILNEDGQLSVGFLLAFEHHPTGCCQRKNLLLGVDAAVFVTYHEDGSGLWFLDILLDTFPVMDILCLFDDDHLALRHHWEAAGYVGNLS